MQCDCPRGSPAARRAQARPGPPSEGHAGERGWVRPAAQEPGAGRRRGAAAGPGRSGCPSASARLFPSGLPACFQGGPDLGRGPFLAGVLTLSGALLSSLSPGPDSVPPARHEVCPALPQEAGPGLGDTLHLKLATSQPGPFPVVPAATTLSLWVRPPPPQPPKRHSS